MDPITKWRLSQVLTITETSEVIQELFEGSKKGLNYEANTVISPILVELYKTFTQSENSAVRLSFSMKECARPFVCLDKMDDKFAHIIFCDKGDVYIYE